MSLTGEKRLAITLAVTIFILAGEVIGGYLSNSLALLSDAGHMVTDALAIALGLVAARISRRPADRNATFGYQRVGVLAALINGLSLLVIAILIFYESYERFLSPPAVDIPVMIGIAVLGLAGNLAMAFILGHSHEDLNVKSVWLHVLGDTLSSLGVIISGTIIYFTGWTYADPVASVLIGGIIIWGGIRLVRDTTSIFLNLTPKGFDVETLAKKITGMADVVDIHDIHLWPIAHNNVAFSAHILVDDKTLKEMETTKKKIEEMLKEYGVDHSTLQIECSCVNCDNSLYCQVKHGDKEEQNNHLHKH
ncbi:MAG: Cadmium, cobalt and zinc/H(+)-K(+) antiporter [Syntrophorhabdaceae bacterium PtaU1.Bin034]|jgi:cobalt-zinc-cadmium efflux system protein|nr:MAG: Cadmium, cobalt and zinc/H(+)-K(+) antiporter [Syntrophorhabdaceae bacterium PtaU1.Bin034]